MFDNPVVQQIGAEAPAVEGLAPVGTDVGVGRERSCGRSLAPSPRHGVASVALGPLVEGSAHVDRLRPQVGGNSGPSDLRERCDTPWADDCGQASDLAPPHLQIAGSALVVRGVEHQVDPFGTEFVEAAERERGEESAPLVVGIGGGVDGADSAQHLAVALELPAHEQSHGDDSAVVDRHPCW